MAYADNVATIKSYCEELNSIYSSLSNVDFSSCWEGTAQLKQKANLAEILNAIKEQLDNCSTLTSALTKIDEYDEKIELISDYTYQMNCLSVDDENYSTNYNYLNKLRSGIITSRDNLKIEINNLLSTISSSYSSVLKSITPATVVNTVDIYKETISLNNSINDSLDISKCVSKVGSTSVGNFDLNPNFSETDAWVGQNPYAWSGFTGQCTWFAWGRFYEIYGYDPGFRGNGNSCVSELVNTHPDKFEKSNTPVAGAVFSTGLGEEYGHVGIVLEVDEANDKIVIQDGNYDGRNNSFQEAQKDWGTQECSLSEFNSKRGGTVYAVPKN